jgi:hypothetical protein
MQSVKQYNFGGYNVGITDGSDLWGTALRWPQMAWYAYKFHEDWFGHSRNIKVITSTVWETAVLVLLMGVIYEVQHWDDLRWQICIKVPWRLVQAFKQYWGYYLDGLRDCSVGITDAGDLWCVRSEDLRWHDTYIPSLMTVGSGIWIILRVLPQLERLHCWYCWWGFLKYPFKMASGGMIYQASLHYH